MKYSDFIRYGEDMLGKSPDDDWGLLPGWSDLFRRKVMERAGEHREEIERDLLFGMKVPVAFSNISASAEMEFMDIAGFTPNFMGGKP